jgi:hypothetical protein
MRTATDLRVTQEHLLAIEVDTRPFGYWANTQKPEDCAQTGR